MQTQSKKQEPNLIGVVTSGVSLVFTISVVNMETKAAITPSVESKAKALICEAFHLMVTDYARYSHSSTSAHVYQAFNNCNEILFKAASEQSKETQLPLWDQDKMGL